MSDPRIPVLTPEAQEMASDALIGAFDTVKRLFREEFGQDLLGIILGDDMSGFGWVYPIKGTRFEAAGLNSVEWRHSDDMGGFRWSIRQRR